MAGWEHRTARINGLDVHYVEQGEGPLVILAHGFPHIWFSWHRQIGPFARAGFRVVAPDLRGMGDTSAPSDPAAYDVDHTVGDLTGLLDHLGAESAIFAGLDFGLFAIYDLAWRHPERVRGIIGLENPAWPHNPAIAPLAEAREWAKNHFVHIAYFEPHGPADADLDAHPRDFLERVFYALSGDYHYLDVWKHPVGATYLEALPQAPPFPWPWLSDLEMEFFVAAYARSGFTGGLNWYRGMDLRWQQRKRFEGVPCPVPFFFIGSENDVDLEAWHGDDPLGDIHKNWSDVRAVKMLPHAGHMLQLERSEEVTTLMLQYLETLR